MGRQVRSNLPQLTETLTPKWPLLKEFRAADEQFKNKQKAAFNTRHQAKELSDIPDNTNVWITTGGSHSPGRVITTADTPRSYLVESSDGQICRNRTHLNVVPENQATGSEHLKGPPTPQRNPIMTRSRTGTNTTPPDRLSL